MPEDLKKAIVEAIAASGDENYKKLLLLLMRVEDVFLERVDALAEQLTVPADQHAEDHTWITQTRRAEGNAKGLVLKIAGSILEKGALVAAGAVAAKFMGV